MSFKFPDRYFYRLSNINIKKDIIDCAYKYVLLDVDNTILTRDKSIVPDDIKKWLEELKASGLKICLISNDWHNNVVDVSKKLNLPIVTRSIKPFPLSFFRALKKIGAKKEKTIMIGDQLLTDVYGAHFIKMKCYLVNPLVEHDLMHTLILRKLESIILRNQQAEKG